MYTMAHESTTHISWSHISHGARASDTSSIPQHDTGKDLGSHISAENMAPSSPDLIGTFLQSRYKKLEEVVMFIY